MPRPRCEPLFALSCCGRQSEIRPALSKLRAALAAAAPGRCAEALDSVEIAVAEVLNNIVEHAGPSDRLGAIRVAACAGPHVLIVRVSDDGRPMPGGRLPVPLAPDLAVPRAELPEGGFGWAIVHELTAGLGYRRAGGRNELTLRFACGDDRPEGRDALKRPD